MPMIVVLGATGKVGVTAASELRRRGRKVRAVVRSPAKAASLAELGCEIVVADLHDRRAVERALDGAERVLAVCPPRVNAEDVLVDALDTIESLVAGIEAARPKHVVAISDYAAQHASGTGVTLILHRLEEGLRALPVAMTFLRSAEQMQNWLRQAVVARTRGVLPSLHHPVTRPFPTVSAYDVGREAAELLESPPATPDRPFVVHFEGPRRYSAEDFASVFEGAFGRSVVARAVPRDNWADALAAAGLGASYARLVIELQDAHNIGRVDIEAGIGIVRYGTTELEPALGPLLKPT